MRVVIADDNLLVCDGLATLLEDAGVEVVARMSSAEELMRDVDAHEPDVAIVDVRMPPSYTDRERDVLGLMAQGLSNQAIAEHLAITVRSTEKHVSSIFGKLGLPATG